MVKNIEKNLKNFYKGKKVLVTGATGFKGAWLCLWLNLLGAKVIGIGFNPNKNKNLFYSLNLNKKIDLNLVDIRNKNKLKILIKNKKPNIIFHLAAQPLIYESYVKPSLTYEVNTIGTLNLLDSVKELNIKSIKALICITSDKCYSNNYSTKGFIESDKLGGDDPYSGSKACAEIIANTYQKSFFNKKEFYCNVATARAGNVIGGGDFSPNRLIPDTVNSIINNKDIFIRNPKFNRPWQHVLEPLYGYLILAEKIYHNPKNFVGSWNFGTSKNTVTNVLEIVNKIVNYWGKGTVKFKQNSKYYEQENLQLNGNKTKKYLKWEPRYSISQSIKVTTEWYKSVILKEITAEKITLKQIQEYMKIVK